MGYAVCHRDATGTTRIDDVASLDAAVAAVERLRNEDGATDVRVFREVPIEVRTYYKVVVTEEAPVADDTPVATPTSPASADVVTEDVTEPILAATPPTPTATVDELPGAFPLASPPAPPTVEVHDADHDTASDASRRHSLFSRGG